MNRKTVCIVMIMVIGYVWFAIAQTNPVYPPIGPMLRKMRAVIDAEVFLLEQRKAILDAQYIFVTAESMGSQILLQSGAYMLREDWLDVADLTTARIDELLLALQ